MNSDAIVGVFLVAPLVVIFWWILIDAMGTPPGPPGGVA